MSLPARTVRTIAIVIVLLWTAVPLPGRGGEACAQGSLHPLTSSRLPIVFIDTGGEPIPNDVKRNAFMGIVDNGPGAVNRVTDPFSGYEGTIGIELRGSSSLMFPKKQFAVETRQADGSNRNVALLGLPRENDWVFYAPFSDKSLMRNVLAYRLARDLGRYASRSRFFELVLNGDYRGVYVLFERIKRDNDRVDIATLNPDENEGDDLTGGYIIKIDKRDGENVGGWSSAFLPFPGSTRPIFYQYHEPEPDEITEPQRRYIQGVVERFERHLAQDDIAGYEALVDVGSLIDFFLINEISRNVDGYRLSAFLYKDKDSNDPRLHLGPVWDFNLGFGNANYYDGADPEGWQFRLREEGDAFQIPFWWPRLLADEAFLRRLSARWLDLRDGALRTGRIHDLIDAYADTLGPAVARNFARWPVLGSYVWPNAFIGDSHAEEIDYLKTWIADRLAWMDEAIPQLRAEGPTAGEATLVVYPNPVVGRGLVAFTLASDADVRIEIFDVLGRRVWTVVDAFLPAGRYVEQVPGGERLSAGTYVVRMRYGEEAVTRKFVRLSGAAP